MTNITKYKNGQKPLSFQSKYVKKDFFVYENIPVIDRKIENGRKSSGCRANRKLKHAKQNSYFY